MKREVELVLYDRCYFEKSRLWLEDDEINRLTDTGILPDEPTRLKWFESLPSKKDYLIWGVAFEGQPIGACGLKHISDSKAEYWGYIGEKSLWGKGLGTSMLYNIEQKAKELKIEELYLTVLEDNIRAIRMYRKNGFIEDSFSYGYFNMTKIL